MGRKPTVILTKNELQKMYDQTPTNKALADQLGISATRLYQLLDKHGIERNKRVSKVEII